MIAWIPARSGSVRLRNKNLRVISSSTLVSRSIESALKSNIFSGVYIDTDSEVIQQEAVAAGAKSIGLRSEYFSGPNISSSASLRNWIERFFAREGYRPSELMILQPTSPLRTAEDIIFFRSQLSVSTNSAMSVSEPWQPIQDVILTNPSNFKEWAHIVDEADSPRLRFVDGSIFYLKTDWFLTSNRVVVSGQTEWILTSRIGGLDVDDEFQLMLAQKLANPE